MFYDTIMDGSIYYNTIMEPVICNSLCFNNYYKSFR